jgi:hypothetical protein
MQTQTEVVEKESQRVPSRTYYSRATGLVVRITKGDRVRVGEQLQRVNEKIIQFQPFGAGEFGMLIADDPEVIAKMEERAALPGSDVMTAEQFNEQLIPAAQKVDALRNENDQQNRTIQEQNRIIAELQRGQKDKPNVVRQ